MAMVLIGKFYVEAGQAEKLERLSKIKGVSQAVVVRDALDKLFKSETKNGTFSSKGK